MSAGAAPQPLRLHAREVTRGVIIAAYTTQRKTTQSTKHWRVCPRIVLLTSYCPTHPVLVAAVAVIVCSRVYRLEAL